MRRISFTIHLLCILFTIVACSSSDDSTTPELIVTETNLDFANQGGELTFNMKSTVDWTIESSADWCHVSEASGKAVIQKITVSADENTDVASRTCTLVVQAGDLSKTIQIKQQAAYSLTVATASYDGAALGEGLSVQVNSATEYTVSSDVDWIEVDSSVAHTGNTFAAEIARNPFLESREGHIEIKAGPLTQTVTVVQDGNTGSDAVQQNMRIATEIAAQMKLGWNIGNTLEAYNNDTPSETAWGNPKVTQQLISAVKSAGFNSVRIPCAWNGYIVDQNTYRISESWLARVKEVVDYCISEDMYVMINIHWDGGWLENHVAYDTQEGILKKEAAIWNQIAIYFRDYNDHLLFAGNNEVHDGYGTPTDENLAVQASYNQTFVDAVRATKGNNLGRCLIVQSYNTNVDLAVQHLTMPNDVAANRLMAEVHYYDPWDFCGDSPTIKYWGTKYASYGTLSSYGQEDYLAQKMASLKTAFVDKGIPVILGEFNAFLQTNLTGEEKTKHETCRNYYLQTVVSEANKNGVIPFYWDAGGKGSALFNRSTGAIYDEAGQAAIDAMITGLSENVQQD